MLVAHAQRGTGPGGGSSPQQSLGMPQKSAPDEHRLRRSPACPPFRRDRPKASTARSRLEPAAGVEESGGDGTRPATKKRKRQRKRKKKNAHRKRLSACLPRLWTLPPLAEIPSAALASRARERPHTKRCPCSCIRSPQSLQCPCSRGRPRFLSAPCSLPCAFRRNPLTAPAAWSLRRRLGPAAPAVRGTVVHSRHADLLSSGLRGPGAGVPDLVRRDLGPPERELAREIPLTWSVSSPDVAAGLAGCGSTYVGR